MANEIKNILRLLIENIDESFSIRKISILRKINYKSAYNAIMKLEEQGLAKLERLGNTTKCSFNLKLNPLVFDVESERREEFLRNKDFKLMCSRLKEFNLPFIALIFGSSIKRAKRGMSGRKSDIDLLIISEQPKEVGHLISLIPLNIHLTNLTYKEFILMLKSKEFSVVSEVIKHNVILYGVEDYYRMVENAR